MERLTAETQRKTLTDSCQGFMLGFVIAPVPEQKRKMKATKKQRKNN